MSLRIKYNRFSYLASFRCSHSFIINWASFSSRGWESNIFMPSYSQPSYYGLQVSVWLSCMWLNELPMGVRQSVKWLCVIGGLKVELSWRERGRVCSWQQLITHSSLSLFPARCSTLWAAPTSAFWWTFTVRTSLYNINAAVHPFIHISAFFICFTHVSIYQSIQPNYSAFIFWSVCLLKK